MLMLSTCHGDAAWSGSARASVLWVSTFFFSNFWPGNLKGRFHAVFIPGLTDGLLSHRYCKPLGEAFAAKEWALVQPLLTSSYTGWGMSSLDQDVSELTLLAHYLGDTFSSKGYVLIGHSTGCQDAVRYVQKLRAEADTRPPLLGVILQGAVSDREFLSTLPGMEEMLPVARQMVQEGRGEDVLARDIFEEGTPSLISARRFLALMEKGGDDDMFSSDLTDTELATLLGHMSGMQTLVMLSGADEYVPPQVNTPKLMQRMCSAMGSSAKGVVIEGADHALTGHAGAAVESMLSFCLKVQPV